MDTLYEAGDDIELTLAIDPIDGTPADASTTATVECRLDDGTVRTITAYPDPDRGHWRALLTHAAAGEWRIWWRVSGHGSGVQSDTVLVGPGPVRRRAYATTGQLAEYLGRAPEEGAARMLARATEWVDALLIAAVYDVSGPDDLPTDPRIAAALRDAVCAYVEWWYETGDDSGSGAAGQWRDIAIGSVRLAGHATAAQSSSAIPPPPPAALRALSRVGLLSHGPYVVGHQ